VGCGRHSSLTGINKGSLKVGLDHYEPYIQRSRHAGVHDHYVIGDARRLPFRTGSFDCAVATEILEHMEKKDGVEMIAEMERVARKKIILTTPNGFLPTAPGPEDNPDEEHLSGWTAGELEAMGFKVYGFSGPKGLWTIRNGRAVLRFVPRRPHLLSAVASDLAGLFVHNRPARAFQLFFVKELDG